MKAIKTVITIVSLCWSVLPSYGVVIAGTNGSTNTNAPADDPGFGYVGVSQLDRSTVYLGGGWFITANHNGAPSTITMDGSVYSYAASSWTRLTNSVGAGIDLALFRITEAPSGGVTISTAGPSVDDAIVMIGNGRDRTSDLIKWDSSWNVVTKGNGTYSGYEYSGSETALRWGNNTVYATNLVANGVICFASAFDNITGEGQGSPGDSGGGVFVKNGTEWELAGIMLYVGTFSNQLANTAVFGNSTYMADLSKYRDQINQVIPEPTTGTLLAGVALVFGVIKRMRYMYQ
jgi:hypothetical protein